MYFHIYPSIMSISIKNVFLVPGIFSTFCPLGTSSLLMNRSLYFYGCVLLCHQHIPTYLLLVASLSFLCASRILTFVSKMLTHFPP